MTFAGITLPTISNTAGLLMLDLLRSLVQAGQTLEASVQVPEKSILLHTDFSAAALTKTVTLHTSILREEIHEVVIDLGTQFAGAGISSLTAEVGIAGDTAKYIMPFDLLQAVGANSNDEGKFSLGRFDLPVGTDIEVLITAVGANLDQLSAGSVNIWLMRSNLA